MHWSYGITGLCDSNPEYVELDKSCDQLRTGQ